MPLNRLRAFVTRFVKNNKDYFTPNEANYLYTFDVRFAYIYGLPKIHKCQKLKQLIKNKESVVNNILTYPFNDLKIPFRPIVSGKSCPVSRLCELAAMILRPFEKSIPHLIIDTTDFLRKLPKKVFGFKTTMVAIDIVQLYPSISNELGKKALTFWFEKYTDKFFKKFDKEFSLKLIDFIQNNVYLTFNETTYRQIQGTAMGKDQAPPYANLTIAFLIIIRLYPMIEEDLGTRAADHIRNNLKVFLDDGFTFLDESIISSACLLNYLNDMDDKIKFTMDCSNEQIPFLDVLVKMEKDEDTNTFTIHTDIFHKETDAFNYFPFNSSAPRHIARNIPYNLARRISMIVSENQIKETRFKELKLRLLDKKYPVHLIDDAIKTARNLNRADLIVRKDKKDKAKAITMVINHNPNIRDPSIKTKECAAGLMFTEKVAGGLVDYPKIIVARRQPPNLLRSLSLSVTRDQNQNYQLPKDSTFSKCTDPRCQFCQLVITSSTYTTKNGTLLKRNQPMCCKTMDLIYVLICQKCKGEYVGETGVTINERTNLHRSQIIHEKYRKLKVSQHIFHCSNGLFNIFPYYK